MRSPVTIAARERSTQASPRVPQIVSTATGTPMKVMNEPIAVDQPATMKLKKSVPIGSASSR